MRSQLTFFLKRIVVFSVFAIVLYSLLLFVSGEFLPKSLKKNLVYKTTHNYLRLKEVKQISDVSLLFLGSSHAYRGFDTRIFKEAGYDVFNFGSSAQTPTQTLLLLSHYLKQLNPKLVVLEVFPDMFTSDGVESTLDLISNDTEDLYSFKMIMDQKNVKVFNTYIYAKEKELIGFERDFKLKIYHQGGYVSRPRLTYNNKPKPEFTKLIFNEEQFFNFEMILEMLKKEDIKYLLVQAPITSGMYQSFSNIEDFNKKMAAYGDYYNFNNKLYLNDSLDFYDSHHLNQNGVTVFNKAFIELLDTNYSTLLKPLH